MEIGLNSVHTKSAGNWEVREIKEKMRDELIYSGRRREERRGGVMREE